jgi:hypothetical protein
VLIQQSAGAIAALLIENAFGFGAAKPHAICVRLTTSAMFAPIIQQPEGVKIDCKNKSGRAARKQTRWSSIIPVWPAFDSIKK